MLCRGKVGKVKTIKKIRLQNDWNQYDASRCTSCQVLPRESACDEWDNSQENDDED